ncbi:MAG: hypothetical protein WBA10_13080 [Elainellaceae cyanobacterium]
MLSQEEFEEIIADTSKRIDSDITWEADESHALWVKFRVEIVSDNGYPLFIKGNYNQVIQALTFVLVHVGFGRIYGLDLGKDHRNPDGIMIGEKHKHRWSEALRDKQAYVPEDITAPANQPVEVWQQFCLEAAIEHNGTMRPPPAWQPNLFL